MSTDSALNEDTESTSPPADVTDDSCMFKYIEVVPLTRDTDESHRTECDSAEVKQEHFAVIKQEPQEVRCIGFFV